MKSSSTKNRTDPLSWELGFFTAATPPVAGKKGLCQRAKLNTQTSPTSIAGGYSDVFSPQISSLPVLKFSYCEPKRVERNNKPTEVSPRQAVNQTFGSPKPLSVECKTKKTTTNYSGPYSLIGPAHK